MSYRHKCDIRTAEHALLYIADCTLATVESMAMKKSRGAYEYERQISIAQSACDWIWDFKIDLDEGSRVKSVFDVGGKVEDFAAKYDILKKGKT